MPKVFSVTYSNTGRNSALGLNIHHATMTDSDVLRIASAEARRRGTTLEALAGIRGSTGKGGRYLPVRPITSREALAVALEKLSDDGRVFEVAELDTDPKAGNFGPTQDEIGSAARHERSHEDLPAKYWALDALRFHFGMTEADDAVAISYGVHDTSRCGAQVDVNEQGEIIFSCIAKGHNADLSCEPIPTRARLQEEISADIVAALQWLEQRASAAWLAAKV